MVGVGFHEEMCVTGSWMHIAHLLSSLGTYRSSHQKKTVLLPWYWSLVGENPPFVIADGEGQIHSGGIQEAVTTAHQSKARMGSTGPDCRIWPATGQQML
jgi:hypothetical protein